MTSLEDVFNVLVADDGLEEGNVLIISMGTDRYGNPVLVDAVKVINVDNNGEGAK